MMSFLCGLHDMCAAVAPGDPAVTGPAHTTAHPLLN